MPSKPELGKGNRKPSDVALLTVDVSHNAKQASSQLPNPVKCHSCDSCCLPQSPQRLLKYVCWWLGRTTA